MKLYLIIYFLYVIKIITCEDITNYCQDHTKTGENCTENCPDVCFNKVCFKNGACEKCIEKLTGEYCNITCPENCIECNENEICSKCENIDYYGEKCNEKCKCSGGCHNNGKCFNENEEFCTDKKFYGEKCETPCTEINPKCSTCNRNEICQSCKNNETYGNNCESECNKCVGGCYIDGTCIDSTQCLNNLYYGDDCETPCTEINPHCETCNRDKICLSCENYTFFGNSCNNECFNCPGGCDINGTCLNKSANCNDLKFFGPKCDKSCSNCLTCDRNGTCLSCKNNSFYGDQCQNSCENCTNKGCYMNSTCIEQDKCKEVYFFDFDCNSNCQKNCSDKGCKMNGECRENCSIDHYKSDPNNNMCDKVCESNCKNGCRDSDGRCFDCINHNYYGDFCNIPVGEEGSELENCDTATQVGDKCLSCKHKIHYGEKCEIPCSEGCAELDKNTQKSTCDFDGKCKCLKSYYGPNCNQTCEGCGEYGCDNNGYCTEFKCLKGKYGLKCQDSCNCESNSNSLECGKFSGECLNCTFGYFGTNCQKQCNYKCQTGLCCIFKDEYLKPKLSFGTNYKYFSIILNGATYKIEIDYNYGFPLTLFNTKSIINCNNNIIPTELDKGTSKPLKFDNDFTNYKIKGSLIGNKSFIINDKNISDIDIIFAEEIECKESFSGVEGVNGVIGLGFFNSISNALFRKLPNEQNILFYSIKDNNKEEVELIFGSMPKEQSKYIEKLTSCQVIFKNNTDLQGKKMTCKLDGIKSAKHSYGLKLKDSNITFSLGEKSTFILKDDSNYKDYLKNEYFNEKVEEKTDEKTNNIYFLYPEDKINKLRNFGFVFNNFFYSYEPNLFFEKKAKNGKKRFLIEFSDKNAEVILGKEFLEDIKFTINNEEAKIYFYAKNAELCEKLLDKSSEGFKIHLEARETAAIFLAVVIFINLVAFVLYYFLRKKRMNSNDYIKID